MGQIASLFLKFIAKVIPRARDPVKGDQIMYCHLLVGRWELALPPIWSWAGAALSLPELRYGSWEVGRMGAAKNFQKILDYWKLKDV